MATLTSVQRQLRILTLLQEYPAGIHALAFAQKLDRVPASTVYSILKRLKARKLVDGRKQTKAHKGPQQILYSLTDAGKQIVDAAPQMLAILKML